MNFSATITNADNVKLGIRNIGAAYEDVTFDTIEEHMRLAAKRSVPYQGGNSYAYPAPTPNYRRTGNLGRSVEVYRKGFTTVIHAVAYHNGHQYTTYVLGDRDGNNQAWMHVGRWVTMYQAVTSQLDLLVKDTDKNIQELIDRELP